MILGFTLSSHLQNTPQMTEEAGSSKAYNKTVSRKTFGDGNMIERPRIISNGFNVSIFKYHKMFEWLRIKN